MVVVFGVDVLGFVFYELSLRVVIIVEVLCLIELVLVFVFVVGLFVNLEVDEVWEVLDLLLLDLLQFYGDEMLEFCV